MMMAIKQHTPDCSKNRVCCNYRDAYLIQTWLPDKRKGGEDSFFDVSVEGIHKEVVFSRAPHFCSLKKA